jgi:nitroimidazol reductase NimA-like FMN-containing flavoprotein (pyridoxamine 5'-phosphate oxidase superfamily)
VSDRYPVNKKNKVRQLSQYAHYQRSVVHRILDAGLVAQVAFVENDIPVVVPMIYGRDTETLYLHGARKARIIRLLERNDAVCINVTLVDGLVLARSAFNSSLQYRSVTVFGQPVLLDDRDDKLHAMRIISEHTMPGRWDELRDPLEREIKMTGVIAVGIDSASAKKSASMPGDEEEDYDIPIWAGVLPLQSAFGTLEHDGRLLPGVEASEAIRALQGRII